MKSGFIILCFITLPFVFSQYIAPIPNPHEELERPSSLQSIRRRYFPNDIIPTNNSILEEVSLSNG